MLVAEPSDILVHQAIPTWFGIGGCADRLARVESVARLASLMERDTELLALGDGANLLVDDAGVGKLVVSLVGDAFTGWTMDRASGRVRVGAGANLPKLINASVREGLAGLEVLGGIPASVGGAIVMNAGGAFGQIADAVSLVRALDRAGRMVELPRAHIPFGYRHSGLADLVITEVELALVPSDPPALRNRLLEIMKYKKQSQPLAEKSAGCVWKNPILVATIDSIGIVGSRVSAGKLIDRAGLKGLAVGAASVSPVHANFVVTSHGASARDVIQLMRETRRRVHGAFGVRLEPEVVIWRRDGLGLEDPWTGTGELR